MSLKLHESHLAYPERIQGNMEYYEDKIKIVRELSYNTIIETGVGYGYSAHAFLSVNPQARYFGFDIGTLNEAGDWYKTVLEGFNYEVYILDTNSIDEFPIRGELIHIDGDHSERGVYHDLNLAIKAVNNGGYILLDDYKYEIGVKLSVDKFLQENNNLKFKIIDTRHGDVLIYM